MVRAPKFTGNKGMITAAWLLSTAGFALLLAGVASMQSNCNTTSLNGLHLTSLGGVGYPGYLAPVSCGHFFQYTWWITFLHFFAWCLVLAYALGNLLHKTRAALVGILAVAAVLLMDTANTYLMHEYLSTTVIRRMRVIIAGAIIAAIADLLLLLLIGFHDDTTTAKERGEVGGYNVNATDAYTTAPATHTVPVTYNSVPVSHTTAPTVPVNTAV
jgi:hypothetical protein